MNKYIKSINFLVSKKTQNILYGQNNIFKHSVNIYNKLRQWDCNEDVCFAGLFYNIYKSEKDKNSIRNIIGVNSENLIKNNDMKILFADKLAKIYIEVIDDYFDDYDIFKNYIYFRDHAPWTFTGAGKDKAKWRNFKYKLNFKNKIEKYLKKHSQKILKNLKIFNFLKLERVYASANPYGTIHEPHRDYDPNLKGGITIMYYLNNTWNLKYAGETVFFNNGEIIKSIIPRPGRVIIFDGSIEHCARDVRRDVNDLRMVLTFKHNINIG